MANDIDISFIIPSYNSSRTISECINSIQSSARGSIDFEIIVADSSDDDTKKIIKADFDDVIIIDLGSKTPPGAARNAGANAARGDTLVFIDSDCVAANDYCERLKESVQTHNVAGGSVLNGTEGSDIGTAEYYLEFSGFMPVGGERIVQFCPTCNFFIKKDLFNKIGGFSDARTAEDIELSFAIRGAGESVIFLPAIRVSHKNRTEMKRYLYNQRLLGKGSALLRRKYDMKGSFVTRYRFLIPMLYYVRLRAVYKRVKAAQQVKALTSGVKTAIKAGLKSWLDGFKEGTGG